MGLDRTAARYTWTVIAVLLLIGLVYRIRHVVLIFVVALLFAYLLWPLVQFLDRRLPGRPRVLALTLVYVALVGVLITLGISIGSRVAGDANALAARIPDLISKLQPPAAPFVSPKVQTIQDKIFSVVRQQLAIHSQELLGHLPNAVLKIISGAGNLIFVVLIPILSFFFLKDAAQIRASWLAILGQVSHRDVLERIAADLHVLLAQYMRALVLLGCVSATAYGALSTVVGLPYRFLLAAVGFLLEFLPIVGPLTAGIIILAVAGLSGSHHLLAILMFLIAFRLVQDYVVSPHLLSAGMKLHPLLVIFGILAGAEIAGIAGSFISVPLIAAPG